MQKDYCCNGLVLSWKQVSWNRWEMFEQHWDKSRGINRAVPVKQEALPLVTCFLIRPCEMVRLVRIRYDKLDLTKEEEEGGGLRIHEVKNIGCIWQHVWQCLALCANCCFMTQKRHKGFADSSVPSLTGRLRTASFSFLFIWRFGYFFLWKLSWGCWAEGNIFALARITGLLLNCLPLLK